MPSTVRCMLGRNSRIRRSTIRSSLSGIRSIAVDVPEDPGPIVTENRSRVRPGTCSRSKRQRAPGWSGSDVRQPKARFSSRASIQHRIWYSPTAG